MLPLRYDTARLTCAWGKWAGYARTSTVEGWAASAGNGTDRPMAGSGRNVPDGRRCWLRFHLDAGPFALPLTGRGNHRTVGVLVGSLRGRGNHIAGRDRTARPLHLVSQSGVDREDGSDH